MQRKIRQGLRRCADLKKAKELELFFKVAKGEYGEGDKFMGITMPLLRGLFKEHKEILLDNYSDLLKSPYHEERMLALIVLIYRFKKIEPEQSYIYKYYMKNSKYINNWDLVDISAPHIPGVYLYDRDPQLLLKFAKSRNLWERRIAIISQLYAIKRGKFDVALLLAEMLKNDNHDLIHKAVGWMLREIGKVDLVQEEKFLKKHYKELPRTMLRYAIEKFPENKRKYYLKKA